MAFGDNLSLVSRVGAGSHRVITAVAPTGGVSVGQWGVVGNIGGFWLHDADADALAEFCIETHAVEVDNDGKAHGGGEAITISKKKLAFVSGAKNQDRDVPGIIGCTFAPVKRSDTRIRLMVFQG